MSSSEIRNHESLGSEKPQFEHTNKLDNNTSNEQVFENRNSQNKRSKNGMNYLERPQTIQLYCINVKGQRLNY